VERPDQQLSESKFFEIKNSSDPDPGTDLTTSNIDDLVSML
jgi:hypothetical protein